VEGIKQRKFGNNKKNYEKNRENEIEHGKEHIRKLGIEMVIEKHKVKKKR
jgi:hypothetical protein